MKPLIRISTEADAYGEQPDDGESVRETLQTIADAMDWGTVTGQPFAHPYHDPDDDERAELVPDYVYEDAMYGDSAEAILAKLRS